MRPGPGRLYPKNLKASMMHTVGIRKVATINSSGGMIGHRPTMATRGEVLTESHNEGAEAPNAV